MLEADRFDEGVMKPIGYGQKARWCSIVRAFQRDLPKNGVDEPADPFAALVRRELNCIVNDGMRWNALEMK